MKLDRKQVLNVLYQVSVFRADPKNNMAALASDLLRHILTFPLKLLNGIQRNLTGSKILTSSTKFVFFGPKSELKLQSWLIHQRRWHISKTYSAQKVIASNRMHNSDTETCRMKCCCFWFHSKVKFLKR